MTKKIVAIIGRPNVGKSTLFNRLAIRKKAIVHDLPGVTRDRKYADAQIGPFDFTVIDTPGLEEAEDEKLEYRMMQQTMEAIIEADLLCLVVDGKEGVLPEDQFFANFIRRYNKKSVLIVNKCEGRFDFAKEYYKLGFDNVVPISAEHGVGMADLYDAITEELENEDGEEELTDQLTDPIKANYIQIVVSGRPNAGKSTFINSIINNERLLTGPEAGITRESIEIDWLYNDNKFKLIDTAGLRKKGTVTKSLEKLSSSDAINSIKFANTVILMVDARTPLEQQDLNIANYVIDQGRSLLIVVNKWDLIERRDQDKFKEEFAYKIETNLPQVRGLPIIFISALKKHNINMVLDESIRIYNLWNKKITTSKLNDWLGFALEQHPLPLQKGGRRVRIKYMTQTKIRPPTFKLFSNNPEKITDSYTRYLINNLRAAFNLPGVPIRFIYTKTENPYVKS
ncbi:MAG TPA: ribosome biogenesis GTPase Der [Rickettsia endosymbiont of Sericostoma sp.]|jgi:GTPase|uniref:ribosome biogenesis GTPase Der n=1 Tax=unclassified Candidatus Tisiphia TaxID=2996318 RepID=UPI001DD72DF6|nr:ribosome biogenesis GTPase Der [Rickettsia endosymbiont of Platyusa sonomae]HJD56880.1 ribosome biogenesis GTPase Der [Rickettsia endosymbiont of Sericostoma sp. HW-2014]HJD63482.1 ribosome biogenesis GTPase Der [Rickettsia endosymbiont of Sericostoma sp.]